MSSKIDYRLLKRYEELGASNKTIEAHLNRVSGKRPNAVALNSRIKAKNSVESIENVDPSHLNSNKKDSSSKSFGVSISKEKTKQKNKKGIKYKAKKGLLIGAITVAAALGIHTMSHVHIPTPSSKDVEITQDDTKEQDSIFDNIIEEESKEKQSAYIVSNPESTSKLIAEDGNSKFLLQNAKSIFIDNYNEKSDEDLENVSIIKEQINIASSIDENGDTHYFHADRDMNKYENDDNYTVLSGNRYLVFKGDNPYDENGKYRQDLFIGETTLDGSVFDDSNASDTIAAEELSKLASSGILDVSFDFYNNFETNKSGSGLLYLINEYNTAVKNYEKLYMNEKANINDNNKLAENDFEIDF